MHHTLPGTCHTSWDKAYGKLDYCPLNNKTPSFKWHSLRIVQEWVKSKYIYHVIHHINTSCPLSQYRIVLLPYFQLASSTLNRHDKKNWFRFFSQFNAYSSLILCSGEGIRIIVHGVSPACPFAIYDQYVKLILTSKLHTHFLEIFFFQQIVQCKTQGERLGNLKMYTYMNFAVNAESFWRGNMNIDPKKCKFLRHVWIRD